MKKIISLILLVFTCIFGYAQTIDPVLLGEMGQRRDNEKIRVFVIMRQQYDQQQLNRRAAHYTTRAARREFVVNELKQFAEASQYDLRHTLAELRQRDLVSEPKVLWIANAIFFEATRDAILSLADRSDIMVIGLDEERNWLPDGEESQPADPTREITSNVIQVKADQVWNLGYTGKGVVVAVIDSGVNYNHRDLANHLWDGGAEFPHHGYDIYNNDNDPMDDHGHGTHCAGTVCGDGTAGSQTGMAPEAILMCVKCLSSVGSGYDTQVLYAMQWAVDHGCDVLSMSLTGHGHSASAQTLERNTCVNVLNAGVIASIAAGNTGDALSQYPIPDNVGLPGGCPPPYLDPEQEQNPGGLSCSVCVGAVNSSDQAAGFTSHGPRDWSNSDYADYPYAPGSLTRFGLIRPDVCAPGVLIKSTSNSSNTSYSVKSGTSMATPCVAGCMALILSKNINATPAEVCRVLEETAVPLSTGKSNIYGYGRVDALAAVNAMYYGPLMLDSSTINDGEGNGDGKLNAGESVTLNLSLTNDLDVALDGATMVLTTESEYVTITNGTASLPHFEAGQTQTINNMFAFTLSDDAPAKHMIYLRAETFVNGESMGVLRIGIMVYGYILRFVGAAVLNDNNGNGLLDAGETANLHVTLCNVGNERVSSIVGTLSTTYPYLVINSNDKSFGSIDVNGEVSAEFNVSLTESAPESYSIDFSLDLVDANQKHTDIDFELWKKAITLASNPADGGTLSGGGYYGQGQTCTITATANFGYAFEKWTLYGSTVSYLSAYTFEVTGEAEYVAHFQAVTNGVLIGDGAEKNSYLPTSVINSYALSQQIYTADELGLGISDITSVSFFNTSDSFTRDLTIYMVNTSKTAFNSTTDWIPVTEADQVYSGSYTFNSGSWTTINFDMVFAYDGSSNIALIVDDNSGDMYLSSMSCRVSSTESCQALCAYNLFTNYAPYNPIYSGNQYMEKNQVIFGVVSYDYTVNVSANPTGGGTVSGSGNFDYGATCTLTATPNPGYYFVNWTEDGTIVSYDASYSFTVESNRDLVANFVEGSSACVICFNLYDSFGDGWNNNYLVIDYGDGNSEQITLRSGSFASYSREIETGSTIILSWISGNYIGECSFDIVFENGVPIYHAENISSNFQHELNINCALATVPHVITAVANPEEGGTVEGAGTYDGGTVVTLTATPNEGYLFLNWSKNGMVVSCNATYNFTVTEDLDLEAVFMRLEGTLIGQGESTNQYLPSYSYYNYTLSQQIYSPDEIGEGGSITTISYFNAGGTKTRIYDIYMVHTDKLTFDSNTDWITVSEADRVYSGSVTLTQGYWTTIVLDTPFDYDGISNLAVIVDDNTGTGSSGMACRVFNANGDQAICSYNYGTNYDPYDPSGYSGTRHSVKNQIILGIETEVEQTFTLPEGWSWWSTYIEADDLLNQLEASLGTNGMSINTQGAVLVYHNGMWMGGMSSIENKKGYKIKTNAPVEVTIVGQVVNPANCPITITEGANWIGYPLPVSQTVGNALTGFTPSNGDVIMTQGGTTVYRSGHWMPATFTFEPGKGYVYKSTSSETKTLIFSNGK